MFYKLELIGQVNKRYDGYGFGNISQRIVSNDMQFIITSTQTGGLNLLSIQNYCLVKQVDLKNNSLESIGESKPSSEALTHASVYKQNKNIKSVIHVHSPDIWNKTKKLKLSFIADNIPYGTPEMADEVTRLLQKSYPQPTGVFSMLGHEDGVVAYSDSLEKAACLLIKIYSKAIEIPS